ncbi:hypothetical protein C7974DRAFT_46129 [Boeremia exigua]|uniref:uncharacterized protein n=1 Tax=Boeremia exigua TaxID=749465 RepID=UPI001E8D529A|nr:uncharacterized protein C7974DRAFT_46129 [Boeremia exigua]KAH6616530.1 hypothetical protein C7974DRAFT_46129 [Boeremia exigua]
MSCACFTGTVRPICQVLIGVWHFLVFRTGQALGQPSRFPVQQMRVAQQLTFGASVVSVLRQRTSYLCLTNRLPYMPNQRLLRLTEHGVSCF